MGSTMDVVKIIIGGSVASGKTQFIRSISEREVVSIDVVISLERPNDMVGMDFGVIEDNQNDVALVLLGTPGARVFMPSWQVAQHNLLGYIIMVDSAHPVTWLQSRSIIEVFIAYSSVPYIVAANKHDKFNAFSPEDIRLALDIPPEIPVIPCVATDKQSAKRVLVALLDEVLRAGVNNEH